MAFQYDFVGGPVPVNLGLEVCPKCYDNAAYQQKQLILPPDPEPFKNTRPEPYNVDEAGPIQQLSAVIDNDSVGDNFYLDLYDGDPDQGGSSVLETLTGSATRTNYASIMTAFPAAGIVSNNATISIVTSTSASEGADVAWVVIFDAATGGNILMDAELANPQTITLYNGAEFLAGDLSVQGVPTLFADSINGSDSNNGQSPQNALRTLSATIAAATARATVNVGLIRGSVWQESYDVSAFSGLLTQSWGLTGDPPVISAFYTVAATWTQDSTFTNMWYVDVTQNGGGTDRPVVLDNGSLMLRQTSLSNANSAGSGSYYSADCGSANPLRVYINAGGNPNGNGHTYEVTVREVCVSIGTSSTLRGVVARGALSKNGPIQAALDCTVSRCVSAFGTKHNMLQPSGTVTDVVLFENDAPSASEADNIPFVAFASSVAGLSISLTRLLSYTTHDLGLGSIVDSHASDSSRHTSVTCDQVVANMDGSGIGGGLTGGPITYAITNSAIYGGLAFAAFALEFSDTSTVSRSMAQAEQINRGGAVSATWTHVAMQLNGDGIRVLTGSTVTVDHISFSGSSSYGPFCIGWVSDTSGSVTVGHSLFDAQVIYDIPVGATLVSDNNIYGSAVATKPDGRFYHGVQYTDLPTNLSTWRSATGQDANSTAVAHALFTGTPSDGDFSVNSGSTLGVTEHWDYNLRAVASGPPTQFPVIPTTYAQALSYILAPTDWDFYP